MSKITVDSFFVTFNNVQVQTCKENRSFLLYNNKFYITTEYLCFYHKILFKMHVSIVNKYKIKK